MAKVNIQELLKLISTLGLSALGSIGGAGSMAAIGSGMGYSGAGKSTRGGYNTHFIYPILTTGNNAPDYNSVGGSRDREYAHGRTSEEQQQILADAEAQFMKDHIGMVASMPPGPARAAAMKKLNESAKDYAIKVSDSMKSYLPFEYAGINADNSTRINPVASSSWVGKIRRTSPSQVDVYLGPSKNNPSGWYSYGGTPEEVENFLNSPSLGKEITNIRQGNSMSLRKLW